MYYHRDRLYGLCLHIYLPLVHGHTHARTTAFHISVIIVTWMLDTLLSHVHTSLLHMLTTRVYMHVLFLSSCHRDHRTSDMYYCSMLSLYSSYMIVHCYWYGYSRYWTWELLICDPTYIVPVILFPFPVILFLYCSRLSLYCSMLSTELWSSYHVTRIMYSSYSCYIVYLTYQIIKLTWVWGKLDGWLDLIGWCTGSILFSHCRGW